MEKLANDLTGGNVGRQLIKFSMPFLLSNFVQSLYSVADMLIVSWYAGPNSISGVANGGQIMLILTNIVVGLGVGGTVLVGQYMGSKQHQEIEKTVGTLFSVLIMFAFAISAVMLILTGPVLRLIQIPEESFASAKSYLSICLTGTLFIFGFNAISATLHGMGESKRPFYFASIACFSNIALDFLFVGVFRLEAAGAAIATVMSQAVALILSIMYLIRNNFIFQFKRESFKIYKDKLKLLLKVGLPSSVQNVMSSLSFMLMIMLVNSYGVHASAAMGIVAKFNTFGVLPAFAISAAVSSMVAQNIGAGSFDRARKTMYSGMLITLPICGLFFILAAAAPKAVLSMFSDDPLIIREGVEYLKYFCIDYLIVPFAFSANGLLVGAGRTTITMLNGILVSMGLRVPLAILLGNTLKMGISGIGLAVPIATTCAFIFSFSFYLSGIWKKKNIRLGMLPENDIA